MSSSWDSTTRQTESKENGRPNSGEAGRSSSSSVAAAAAAAADSPRVPISRVFRSDVPVPEQSNMMHEILQIFELEEQRDVEMSDGDGEGGTANEEAEGEGENDAEDLVDLEDQARRTEQLKNALEILGDLWWSGSEYLAVVTEKLADGSRNPKWRVPLGNSGVLDFYLEIMSTQILRHEVAVHVLRLIGNSCADTDENRARLLEFSRLSSVIDQLNDTSLLPFAIPVIYNICIDYEPTQIQASKSQLSKELIELLSSPRFKGHEAFVGYVCKLLELMAAQESDLELAPENTSLVLFTAAVDKDLKVDMEDFMALVNTAVAYLQHEKFQKALISHGGLDTMLTVIHETHTRFDSQLSPEPSSPQLDEDDFKALSQIRNNLNQVLSDVSALPEFGAAVPVTSPFSKSLRRWLSSPQRQLQICACIILGNLARSDAACEEFVHTSQIHKPLIAIIITANDSQLLHAALGFLKNLALPMKNKVKLAEDGLLDALPRLWNLDTLQQVQFSAISIGRQLLIGSFENVRRIATRLSEDEDSPASQRSMVSLLISLFDRTDVEPIKTEISRLFTVIFRVWNSFKDPSEQYHTELRENFLRRHPDIGRPLAFMVTQTKWPVVRSEGWFVFALMARYPDGAGCISDVMHDIKVYEVLVHLMTGKKLVDYVPASMISTSSATVTTPPLDSTMQSTFPTSTTDTRNTLKTNPSSFQAPDATPSTPNPTPQNTSSSSTSITATNVLPTMPFSTQAPEAASPHAQADEMQRLDRENALVLLNELLKNRGNQMAVMKRAMFEDLLQAGGQRVLADKEGRGGDGDGGDGDGGSGEGWQSSKDDMQYLVQESASELS